MILKVRTYRCHDCDAKVQALKWNYEAPPDCPNDHGPMFEGDIGPQGRSANVIGDDIPGGQMVEHAICNPDGTPRRFDTKSSIREEARRQGWTISGETPKPRERRWI